MDLNLEFKPTQDLVLEIRAKKAGSDHKKQDFGSCFRDGSYFRKLLF
jgi:hypothetical protein